MKPRDFVTCFLISSLLCACVHKPANVGTPPDPNTENPTMTATDTTGEAGHGAAPLQPKLSAHEALARLLELIRTTNSADDFTPTQLQEAMGVPIKYARDGANRYGFGEPLTSAWSYGFGMDLESKFGARFEFSFNQNEPGATGVPMSDICQLDFDQFTAELEKMGFKRERYYGEHGRFIHDWFDRSGMRIEVYPDGEFVWTPENGGGRSCVKMVLIP